ncbi:hypothetical protein GA0115240_112618 [Streptomyces sp. DvalAA-14]|uniref:DUF11 domain-containing protein n=1 Tax=unclassified Streptomyces TaxID=2593676 RepID=UPI00081BC1F0|nr:MULTISPECIES: DUF11 domain-containing protein [unclassified Streptomyces]MYS19755.1 hypothetical protein [Streptomyces sp. SID4948]SCD52310.1 hypothetical protein GA0115240_112618 [Streptomyces sp. DvalAA-14]
MIHARRHRALALRASAVLLAAATLALPTVAHADTPTADAAVTLTAVPHFALLAPSIVYTVRVTDNGPDALTGARVTTAVADVLTPESGGACTTNPGSAVCSFGPIASGSSQTQTFTLPINPVTVALTLRATATITASSAADPDTTNNTETVDCTYLTALDAHCS